MSRTFSMEYVEIFQEDGGQELLIGHTPESFFVKRHTSAFHLMEIYRTIELLVPAGRASRPATIAADTIRWPLGAKRLTTSGFNRQRISASLLAAALAADPRRLLNIKE